MHYPLPSINTFFRTVPVPKEEQGSQGAASAYSSAEQVTSCGCRRGQFCSPLSSARARYFPRTKENLLDLAMKTAGAPLRKQTTLEHWMGEVVSDDFTSWTRVASNNARNAEETQAWSEGREAEPAR